MVLIIIVCITLTIAAGFYAIRVNRTESHAADEPKGIRGWLLLFGISLGGAVIIFPTSVGQYSLPVQTLVSLYNGEVLTRDHPYYSPWWRPLVLGEAVYTLGSYLATCWLFVLFLRQKVSFPRHWVRVNVTLAFLLTLDAIAIWAMWRQFPYLWKREDITGFFLGALGGWVITCISASYLRKSIRVKNTFVR